MTVLFTEETFKMENKMVRAIWFKIEMDKNICSTKGFLKKGNFMEKEL
jgi:hypothetical protein